ncbi:hypothetical protein [Embleya sp. NPDC005971]|uniref:hypothetical protein n=1 Tax=Embleya sp. NPDC005971 TaxID=3156724 RepID=UPI0033D7F5F7
MIGYSDGRRALPYLLVEDWDKRPLSAEATDPTSLLVSSALRGGLHLTAPSGDIEAAPAWQARYRDATLTVTTPALPDGPFLNPMPLTMPDGWCEAARAAGSVVLFVGDDLGLASYDDDPDVSKRVMPAAARGALAAGSIPYTEH